MELIATGCHTKKIAAQLEIHDRTVDVHRFNIMRKVGVRTLAELLRLWSMAQQQTAQP
jgi:FixJ family two-component response regulator